MTRPSLDDSFPGQAAGTIEETTTVEQRSVKSNENYRTAGTPET